MHARLKPISETKLVSHVSKPDFGATLLKQVTTLVEGNEVGGNFYLNDTDAIASDATAEEMETLLEATDLGDINVTR